MSFKISEVCDINSFNLSKNDNLNAINYLDTANLNVGTVDELQYMEVGKDKIPSRAKRIVRKNDILISTVRPNQKHYGIIKNVAKNMVASTGFAVLTPKEDKVDPGYIYNYLIQDHITTYLHSIAESSTSTYPSIKPSVIGDLEVDLPPLEEQKTIAHILSTLDDKIEVNNQINKTLENMAQAIFKQWFVDFEFPNEDGEPYKSSGGEMVESELGTIPKGWEVSKFFDLIEITSGKRPGKRSDLAMEDCKYSLVGASSIMGYTDDFNFEEKILVIGRVGTHGVVQRLNNKVWASDNTLVIKSDKYEFAYQILNQIDYKAINRGSTQPLITQTDIKNHTLIIPTESHLNKFELLVGSLFGIHSNLCLENSKLTEIRDSLLPKLMSGEIRVPLDEDGYAS